MEGYIRTGFLIKKELKEGAEAYARENSMSASSVYNLAIKSFLENEQMKKLLLKGFDQKVFLEQAAAAFIKAQESAEQSNSKIGA